MSIVANIILILFLPAQFYLYGFFSASKNIQPAAVAQVEGASTEN